jgi:hypothetical protein
MAQGEFRRAARLLGAADAVRKERGFDLYAHALKAHSRATEAVGPRTEFDEWWQEGTALSYERAAELALE